MLQFSVTNYCLADYYELLIATVGLCNWQLTELRLKLNSQCSDEIIIIINGYFFGSFVDLNLYGEALSLASNYPDIFGSTHSNGFGY